MTALAALPGRGIVASGSARGCLKLWDADSTAQIEEQVLHTECIHALAATSTHLFSASKDKTVKVRGLFPLGTKDVDSLLLL